MPCKINNLANCDITDMEPHIHGMYDYFDQKLMFQKPPVMVFDTDLSNQSNVLGKTAYYDPSTLEIHIFTDGRHPKDMLRSIAHELIHHKQNLDGQLDIGGYMGPGYYLKNKDMKNIEDQAMKYGNGFMREYEDHLKLEESKKMSLKEWKNNELNQLLLKKWKIIKEEKELSPEDEKIAARTPPKDKLNKGDFLPPEAAKDLDESNCGAHKENSDIKESSYETRGIEEADKGCPNCANKDGDCDCKEKVDEQARGDRPENRANMEGQKEESQMRRAKTQKKLEETIKKIRKASKAFKKSKGHR